MQYLETEWLETNGLGGWAMGTLAGATARRYHGLLTVALNPPVDRRVLISRLNETLWLPASADDPFGADDQCADLHCQTWAGGATAPNGQQYLVQFARDLFPVWEYAALGIRLRRTVVAVSGENTTLVLYEVLEAPRTFTLDLTPLLADRDIHALTEANPQDRKSTRLNSSHSSPSRMPSSA